MVVVRKGGGDVARDTHTDTHRLDVHTGCAHARRAERTDAHTHLRLRTFNSFHIDMHTHTHTQGHNFSLFLSPCKHIFKLTHLQPVYSAHAHKRQ